MRCISTKIKVKKITFYFTIYLINVSPLITEYQWIEKNTSFYLIYNIIFYPFWLVTKENLKLPLLRCCLSLNHVILRPDYKDS